MDKFKNFAENESVESFFQDQVDLLEDIRYEDNKNFQQNEAILDDIEESLNEIERQIKNK